LRFLRWSDLNSQDFARLVPRTPCWRLAHLPWEDLLATTGLRNKELRSLELQDIHWRAAEVLVRRPKAGRDRVVPLVQEAGKALAEYVNGVERIILVQLKIALDGHRPAQPVTEHFLPQPMHLA
jgi:integrase/recombinase XerD